MELEEFRDNINYFTIEKKPYIFLIDYEMEKPLFAPLDDASAIGLYYDIKGMTNYISNKNFSPYKNFLATPISKNTYLKKFNKVQSHLTNGDTYLLNLTFSSKLETSYTLEEIFNLAKADYKLFMKDQFVLFSPECFIEIKDNIIYSYPMKGTIDADIANAEQKLLSNPKEEFEHNTIIDLIRNDLSMIASETKVTKYRFIKKITSQQKDLLQVSSEIRAKLPTYWRQNWGDALLKLLPAGSISGAPKTKTCKIIKETELGKRGYYTGIFGIYDGTNLNSAVNIRYIEFKEGILYYHSGGGITALSDMEEEYQELKNKIYVPVDR